MAVSVTTWPQPQSLSSAQTPAAWELREEAVSGSGGGGHAFWEGPVRAERARLS